MDHTEIFMQKYNTELLDFYIPFFKNEKETISFLQWV